VFSFASAMFVDYLCYYRVSISQILKGFGADPLFTVFVGIRNSSKNNGINVDVFFVSDVILSFRFTISGFETHVLQITRIELFLGLHQPQGLYCNTRYVLIMLYNILNMSMSYWTSLIFLTTDMVLTSNILINLYQ